MRAVTYQGKKDIQVKSVEDPKLLKKDDIIVKITSTTICGSDLHLYQGNFPLPKGYIIGHEPMGIVEEVGTDITSVKKGDRVVIPFNVACGSCHYCTHHMESQCDNANPHYDSGAFLGYSEKFGDYPGGQADYLRVPYANFTPLKIPNTIEMEDEYFLFLSDVLPTAYWSVMNSGMKKGDSVIVLGCGPVGLFAQKFAWMLGANRVIAVDHLDYRLNKAKKMNNVETVNFSRFADTGEHLKEMTLGGADVVIDCVGMDGKKSPLEKVGQTLKLQGGTLGAIQIATKAVRKFGTVQITGVYGGLYNSFPLGAFFSRNVTLKMGQAPVIHLMNMLMDKVLAEEFDPREIITHTLPLDEAAKGYDLFNDHKEDCIKVVLKT